MASVSNASLDVGLLDREGTIAKAGFNRWLVPPAALAIHLCIGMAYGFSVFWKPLQGALVGADGKALAECSAGATTFGAKSAGTLRALAAIDCNWSQFDVGWMYTLFFVVLGLSAAIWGGWLERSGPRKAGVVSALCWCGGLLLGALGVYIHQLWLMWLGAGTIGGIGLGLGYISPVSTLIKWFPDRRGMATGMAIMGFGGGAMIGTPLANLLMNYFKTPTSPGVWQTLVCFAAIYSVFMLVGAFLYRVTPEGWVPEGWTAPASSNAMITAGNVHLKDAHKTPQFWLIWIILCMNVSAGIGIIGAASPMLQETFGGRLFGDAGTVFEKFTPDNAKAAATIGGAFVGLFSLFNIVGRFFWSSMSDKLGRKNTYFIFFILGIACYALLALFAGNATAVMFALTMCIIASMYGGGFATVPAYLSDMFGTLFVGAIHGRLLTAWSTAGILGPFIVNYLHDTYKAGGTSAARLYPSIFYVLLVLLAIGFVANFLVKPVESKWFMNKDAVSQVLAERHAANATGTKGSFGIGLGNLFAGPSIVAWLFVGIPMLWGAWQTLSNVLKLFG